MLDKVRLDEITTFPKLLGYLRDELDWPIEEENFDDLTFDYTPADFDLKLDGEKGRIEIKQLRPLVSTQPWGIFFLNFPGKDMPVTVLRRILGKLARKKWASQNPAERAVWDKNDLLFIASFGKTGERQLSFAHFQDRSDIGDLPALRVLGWDGQNTIRRLSYTNDILKSRLSWPDDPRDLESWRERWGGAFTEGKGESVATSKAMAQELARLARQIRARANELLDAETEQGPLRQLHTAFREALIHDLKPDDFADMYAQTIAYGLLSARIARASGALTADDAALMAPATNPFLQELLKNFLQAGGRKGGMDFDELGVNEVVEMLRDANMEAVLRDFDDRNPQEDPVIHFYELFLKEYDAKKRMQRGVFYTPRPVVSFIVRSVDEVLRTEFGLEDGLADTATWADIAARNAEVKIPEGVKPSEPFVKVLDPATGTGTFLVEVIGLVHERMAEKWRKIGKTRAEIDALWNEYVPEHLLPRLYGFELMMAPYAIAHMKLGVKLADTGYHFRSKERARIYLTNALEEPHDLDMQLAFMSEALAHEARAANEAKGQARFTAVIGNPPYAGHSKNNNIPWIVDKVHDYKRAWPDLLKPGQGKWLQDDYVKFLRLAQYHIDITGVGLVGFITNHSFTENPTFKGMRTRYLSSFALLRVLDLHGSVAKRGRGTDSAVDENVFQEIAQGVAVTLAVKLPFEDSPTVTSGDLFGPEKSKLEILANNTIQTLANTVIQPTPPENLFVALDSDMQREFTVFPSLPQVMDRNGDPAPGMVTTHDEFAISFTREEQSAKVRQLLATRSEHEARQHFRLCTQNQWNYENAKRSLSVSNWESQLTSVSYRPFDRRFTIYNSHVAVHRRERSSAHFLEYSNIGMVGTRQKSSADDIWNHVFCSSDKIESTFISNRTKEINYLFPLWLKPSGTDRKARPNLSPAFIDSFSKITGLTFDEGRASGSDRQERGDLKASFGARDIFDWIYAVLHSPSYRKRYADFLRSDFARIPLPKDGALFKALVPFGTRLVALHLVDADVVPALGEPTSIRFAGSGSAEIPSTGGKNGYPRFVNGRVYVNPDRWFEEVPGATWEFHVGGYQVCEKWLKDRRGRSLSADDIVHYRRIVHALTETRKIMAQIDTVIEAHGGWPDAFRGMAD